ncbi:hypothetical protein JX266_003126 [Neoarthrinium moseri]|nr:hypothetical protein JX266_003126 [Neoarthrinium moseri]
MSDVASESTALLGASSPSAPRSDEPAAGKTNKGRVIAVSFILMVLVDFAGFLIDAPQTSILETIICDQYYSSGSPSALADCTVGPVQAELATVNQLLNTFNLIPGLLVALPFGVLADRYGRRPVLALSLIGIFIQDLLAKLVCWRHDIFPPRLIWLSSAARLIGGGDIVASSMIYLTVADVVPADQRANVFFVLSACILVGDIIATPLSALLMSKDPWIPYLIAGVLSFLGGIIPLLFLPETLSKEHISDETAQFSPASDESTVVGKSSPKKRTLASKSLEFISKIRSLASSNVVAVLLAFFVASLGRQSTGFLLQYVRQRFNWSYEKASFLIALRGSIHLVLLLLGLPSLNKLLTRYAFGNPARDLFTSRISVFLLTIGSLVIAVAPLVPLVALGVAVFALGSGFAPAARSLATALVHPDEAGTLYSALGLMQSLGGLVAGPMLAGSFRWGLNHGREWTGVPFLLVAGLFGFGVFAMSFVRLQDPIPETCAREDEETPTDTM